jgi:hypothetical protein
MHAATQLYTRTSSDRKAATADLRYSQWMTLCTLTAAALLGLRRWQRP